MLRKLSLALCTAVILSAGCHSKKQVVPDDAYAYIREAQQLRVRLVPGAASPNGKNTLVSFTVTNPTNKALRFCKWETPFEPRTGKYFEVTDANGNEAAFQGAMARRIMPPPASAYITVPAHNSVKTVTDLADSYRLTARSYVIRYTGSGVSGLRPGNKISIRL
ncbi:hypothetical protein D0C36_20420 [Mucilaginibacter conchicola]|uniref:Protease n=1 Tax=Mucilaginibacter conchicola TaxID=2303333 RepID=A0A372NRS2_9SPHI|nr:hypothetical protein [Mucilaginibacter conchicola]RFZ91297.1 hypothetical protein D0C36_20420 [Mucilaginibacter conchicola]